MDSNILPSGSFADTEKIVSNEEDEEQGINNVALNEQEIESNNGVSNQTEEEDDSPVVLRQKTLGKQQRSEKLDSVNSRDLILFILKNKEAEYTTKRIYSVFCGTWNVNGQNPPNIDLLNKWFNEEQGSPRIGKGSSQPDIFVIGFQEVGKYFWGELNIESKWSNAVQNALAEKGLYREVKLIRMARIMMIVYVKESLMTEDVLPDLIDAGSVATGVMGSKGGVGVRIIIHNTSLCFINTHLAAHQEKMGKRNEDYRNVEKKMNFKNMNCKIFDHDTVFWIGDLNYRIDDMEISNVKEKISKNEYSDLLRNDQLLKQLGRSDVFQGYTEGNITFKPTYKYDKNSNDWDSSPKSRIPAWCDRILYKGEGINQLHYNSYPDILISDHKPVSSLFYVEVKVTIEKDCNKLKDDIQNDLHNLQEQYRPKVKCDPEEFQYEEVLLIEAKSKTMKIENKGLVPVMFEFAECKPWLTVTPSRSVIKKGSSCEIRLEVLVDETCAASMNALNYNLNDTLKLSFIAGKTKYITVNGNLKQSSFGLPLETLLHIREPIRHIQRMQELPEIKGRLIVPKEVIRLTDHILLFGKGKEELFQQGGLQRELKDIIECLDTTLGPVAIPGSIDSVAEALLLFLKCLPEPVIPSSVHDKCLKASSNYNSCKKVIQGIDKRNKDLFEHLCEFLTKLICSDENVLDINIISSIFGDVLIRNGEEDADNKKKEFIALFLKIR